MGTLRCAVWSEFTAAIASKPNMSALREASGDRPGVRPRLQLDQWLSSRPSLLARAYLLRDIAGTPG
jgi:hypothetical protein